MKTKSEIEARVKELICAELDRRVSEASKRLPTRCIHNYRHSLDTRHQVDGEANPEYNRIADGRGLPVIQTIGLCMLGSEDPESWGGTICEEPIDARKCDVFKPSKGKEAIMPELSRDLQDGGWLLENMPELFGLLWVLDVVQEPSIPWYKRLWFRLLRIRIENVVPKVDPTKLLPESTEL